MSQEHSIDQKHLVDQELSMQIRGIKIKLITRSCIVVCILLLSITYVGIARVDKHYRNLIENTQNCIEGHHCAVSLSNASDYLTEQVRLFVLSGDTAHMYNYFDEVNSLRREHMVTRLEEIYGDSDPETVKQLRLALEASNMLEQKEIHAMRLAAHIVQMPESQLPPQVRDWKLSQEETQMSQSELVDESRQLIYGVSYLQDKRNIKDNIDTTLQLLNERMELRQRESSDALEHTLFRQRIYTFLMMALICAVFCLIGVLIIYPINEHIRSIQQNRPWKYIGGYEIQYLANIYNQLYDKNRLHQKELEYRADHDALTGIYNRQDFERQKEILRNQRTPIALLMADIDDFKQVNDTLGHATGDAVLRRVASILSELVFGNRYYLARIGGDEFALILFNMTEDMYSIIEKEVERINGVMQHGDEELPPISISVGVAFSEHGYSDKLFSQADLALYYTKQNGRRGCSVYEETM